VAAGDQGRLPVTPETAVGLPALMAVIRLISHAAGLVPLNVMRGDEDSERERARDTWQWKLLHKRPGPPPTTPFNFKADLAAQFTGRATPTSARSSRPPQPPDGRRVLELMPMNPGQVKPKRADNGSVVFTDSTGKAPVERGTDEIIHIRSFSLTGGLGACPRSRQARTFVSAGLQRQQFEERHLANGIAPSIALKFPQGMTEDQAKRWLDFIKQEHQGSGKAGKILGLVGGADS
jgi:phage portal protein BeeE